MMDIEKHLHSVEQELADLTVENQELKKQLAAPSEVVLREIAFNLGGWDEVKKLIEELEESDAEAAWERHCNEPEAWEGGFAENH